MVNHWSAKGTTVCWRRKFTWAEEMAQFGKVLECKHTGQSLIPRTHAKTKQSGNRTAARVCNLGAGEVPAGASPRAPSVDLA